jgi:hypothetical protein
LVTVRRDVRRDAGVFVEEDKGILLGRSAGGWAGDWVEITTFGYSGGSQIPPAFPLPAINSSE